MAALSGGYKCIKYLLFTFNFIFWLTGTAVFAVGLWLRFNSLTKGLFEGEGFPSVILAGVYILIAAGGLMMVVGFLGCCGAILESPCMLGLFFSFLLLIFVLEIAAGIWAFSHKDKVVNDITMFYEKTFENYQSTNQEALKETLKAIHHGLNCCGPIGYSTKSDTCPEKEGLDQHLTKSCPTVIKELFESNLMIIGGMGIGIGLIKIVGMIFSMLLCCAIQRTQEVV
ncbi:hypothetical protein AGOR_G00185330 [Albula goreensis]|uniref:Tetraspanin n=1 Tax=Albula goreensis TaxID=1534307 RepID=A0A8T3CY56_9TELE|nr:hypothetical protein AGOR_G00185330 [Albula goreensis]